MKVRLVARTPPGHWLRPALGLSLHQYLAIFEPTPLPDTLEAIDALLRSSRQILCVGRDVARAFGVPRRTPFLTNIPIYQDEQHTGWIAVIPVSACWWSSVEQRYAARAFLSQITMDRAVYHRGLAYYETPLRDTDSEPDPDVLRTIAEPPMGVRRIPRFLRTL
jgi:hypothetical protein